MAANWIVRICEITDSGFFFFLFKFQDVHIDKVLLS